MNFFFENISFLTNKIQRIKLTIIFFGAFIVSLMEIIGLGSLAGFVVILSDPSILINQISNVYISKYLNSLDFKKLLILSGVIIFLVFLIKNIFTILFHYFEVRTQRNIILYLTSSLYKNYLYRDYEYHLKTNPSEMINTVNSIATRSVAFIFSIISLFKEFFFIFLILCSLVIVDYKLTIFLFIVFSLFSLIFYSLIKKKLSTQGYKTRILEELELQNLNQGIGSIKYIKLKNIQNFFVSNYFKTQKERHRLEIFLSIISKIPKLIFEILAVVILSLIVIYFISQNKSIEIILPTLSYLILIIVRMIPAFININTGLSLIKYDKPSVQKIVKEIRDKKNLLLANKNIKANKNSKIEIKQFEFRDISYKFPDSEKNVLDNISFKINDGEMVGIIGESGAGKSTLINIIMGLLIPTEGNIKINNQNIIDEEYFILQKKIGFVPQEIYLIDDNIKNNIAFGISENKIDFQKLDQCVERANLKEFIAKNSLGLEAVIGDRGARISGGQKQRIGIARALYDDPKILIMDEGTSALDNKTEEKVIEDIVKLKKNRIIILAAHRLSTLEKCDKFILLKEGKIIDQGNKSDFLNRQKQFEKYFIKNKD
jgi:ATP-binding cassette, subfamily B, bacterial PglK